MCRAKRRRVDEIRRGDGLPMKQDERRPRRWPMALSLVLLGLVLAIAFGAAGAICCRAATKSSAKAGTSRPAHLCRQLSRAGDRKDSRPQHRQGGHRTGRRRPDGRNRRPAAAGRREGGRSRDHRAAARHDDRRRQFAAVGFLAFATVWVMARAKHSGFDRQLLKAEASGVTIGSLGLFSVSARR